MLSRILAQNKYVLSDPQRETIDSVSKKSAKLYSVFQKKLDTFQRDPLGFLANLYQCEQKWTPTQKIDCGIFDKKMMARKVLKEVVLKGFFESLMYRL